ncbi:MAG: hypothetical protein A2V57_03825 [Candidatus Aminicenantes bacterium RBG_19FT_COMBO_65_30]|nr:MAG: hypothetical protein A2V57_03825 [Candidatus Aminicenantes bacterium RBG_19FT_COMBO_65_30]
MKKVILVALAVVMLAAAGVQPALAQEKKTDLSLNLGVQTNIFPGTSFDWLDLTVDFRVGFALGKSFEISPELMALIDSDFSFEGVELSPGVILNYKAGNFFVGAGVILPIWLESGDSDVGNVMPKINVGYNFGKLKLTGYFLSITESGAGFLKYNYIGATLGYRF